MESVQYNATSGRLPPSPQETRLSVISFETCPGTTFCIRLHSVESPQTIDRMGMSENSWWVLESNDMPFRAMRLYKGSHSMQELLRRYGFQDGSGCVNHKRARLTYERVPKLQHGPPSWIPQHVVKCTGIPQFYHRSGVCWFAAMCGTSFIYDDIRSIIESKVSDRELIQSIRECHNDRNKAEHLRKRLWYEYAVGDNVENPPEMDGRNGFAEFCTLCAKLGVPMRRYRERSGKLVRMDDRVTDQKNRTHKLRLPKKNESHILALRFQDGDHTKRFPIQRRLCIGSQQYKLYAFYAGQKKCGHQMGVVSPTGKWRDWMIVDADLHKDGISPIFVRFEGPQWVDRWWGAWRDVMHVTKYGGGEFCNLSPWNPSNTSLDHYRGVSTSGTNSLDVMYVSMNE